MRPAASAQPAAAEEHALAGVAAGQPVLEQQGRLHVVQNSGFRCQDGANLGLGFENSGVPIP